MKNKKLSRKEALDFLTMNLPQDQVEYIVRHYLDDENNDDLQHRLDDFKKKLIKEVE